MLVTSVPQPFSPQHQHSLQLQQQQPQPQQQQHHQQQEQQQQRQQSQNQQHNQQVGTWILQDCRQHQRCRSDDLVPFSH